MGRNYRIDVKFGLFGLYNKFMSINYGFLFYIVSTACTGLVTRILQSSHI